MDEQPVASTSAMPAYLAPPFISPKAVNDGQSVVRDDPKRPQADGDARGNPQVAAATSASSPTSSADTNPPIPSYLYSGLPRHLLLPDGTPDYLRMCLSADIYSLVKTTPLQRANNLSTKLGCEIYLKREDLQPVFSFKLRGAYNLMRTLEGEQRWKGVIACSAGNHAQGVSLSGLSLSIPCTIVMPLGTPSIKVSSVRALGAKVVLHGQDFDEAKAECARLAETYGLKVIPPFDDPHVIAGQGTVGVELLRQTNLDDLDGVFCCVGGGGLLAGVSSYVKRIAPPNTKVFGVETFDGDALTRSLQAGKRITLRDVGLFADGTAVKIVGEECWRILKQDHMLDGMIRVDTDEICAAIRDTFEDTRTVPEPSGALSLAGLKRYIIHHNLQGSGKKFACVVSGANMNFSRLRFVAERAEVGDGKEVLMMVEIPEQPGAFQRLHSHIHPRSVTEFSYRYNASTAENDEPKALVYISFLLNGQAAGASPAAGSAGSVAATAAAVTTGTSVEGHNQTGSAVNGHSDAHGVRPNFTANMLASQLTQSATLGDGLHHQHRGTNGNGRSASDQVDSSTPAPLTAPTSVAAAAATAGATAQQSQPRTPRDAELSAIMTALSQDGMRATDISTNEMAKSHARYLVGGRQRVPHERLFRFEFPERPGALRKFLVGLGGAGAGWNISLWHYRNHGSDVAKVLVGLQVPEEQREPFDRFLAELGYAWTEETDNEVAQRFL